ncbi:Retinol dehydrogenase 12 [Galdieria sulphuraria]|nr:Retinol dehydrogenase 12 [Galdieria sulphuraria]
MSRELEQPKDWISSFSKQEWKTPAVAVAGTLASLGLIRLYSNGPVYRKTVNLKGKVVVVTGANTGIGKETCIQLAKMGATIVMACRDSSRALKAKEQVVKLSKNEDIDIIRLDLSDLSSVRQFVSDFCKKYSRLDILFCNAGVMALPKRETTKDGFEMQFGVNHLGHFLLTNLLLDRLIASAPSRVIVVSSYGHTFGKIDFDNLQWERNYSGFAAYGASKLANILFVKELDKRLKQQNANVGVYAVHPGAVRTELARYILSSWWKKLLAAPVLPLSYLLMKDPYHGAQTQIRCAIDPSLQQSSGKYFADCKETTPSAAARDARVAEKLWQVSEQLVGMAKK